MYEIITSYTIISDTHICSPCHLGEVKRIFWVSSLRLAQAICRDPQRGKREEGRERRGGKIKKREEGGRKVKRDEGKKEGKERGEVE